MGIFVDYKSNVFSNLKSVGTDIVVTDTNVIWVTSIKVTNRTNAKMHVSLQKVRTQASPVTAYELNEFPVEPKDSFDLINKTGIITLEYSEAPAISDKLVCFATQLFDCDVDYGVLKELPDYE